MEKNRKTMLAGVSAAALAAGLGVSALAGAPADIAGPRVEQAAAQHAPRAADALVELMLRAGEPATAASISDALHAMYGQLTVEQADTLPDLVVGIRGLGLAAEVETAATDTLLDIVASASVPLDDQQLERLAAALSEPLATYQLAAVKSNPGTGKASDTGKGSASDKGRQQGNGLGGYQP